MSMSVGRPTWGTALAAAALFACGPAPAPHPASAPSSVGSLPIASASAASAEASAVPAASMQPAADEPASLQWIDHDTALSCRGGTPGRFGLDGTARWLDAAPRGAGWDWTGASISPDGETWAIVGPEGLHLLDGETGAVRAGPLAGAAELLKVRVMGESARIDWSLDGTTLATFLAQTPLGGEPITTAIAFWDARTGQRLATLGVPGFVAGITWHPRDRVVFANSGYGSMFNLSAWVGDQVSLWRLSDGASLGELPGHTATFASDGRWLLLDVGHPTRSRVTRTHVYDASTSHKILELPGLSVAWASDGSWLLTSQHAYSDTNAPTGPPVYRLFDLPSGRERRRLDLGGGELRVDAATGRAAVKDLTGPSGESDGAIELWDLLAGSRRRVVVPSGQESRPWTWHAGGKVLEVRRDYFDAIHLVAVDTGDTLRLDATVRDGRCVLTVSDGRGAPMPGGTPASSAGAAAAVASFFARAKGGP